MALAETLLRTVHKLGLLPKIIRALPFVSFLFALASIAWLLVLPMDGQYRNTYISENALMPGQVNSYFRESEWNYVRGYRMEVSKWDFDEVSSSNPILESWLQDAGWKIHHHKDSQTQQDTMYGIMHASRGDNTESLALVVPYFTSEGKTNTGAIAIAAAMARYFMRMLIWQKNIIFVFPRDGHTVLRNWVEAYHTNLDDTAGSIEAAIVLEYPFAQDNFGYMELFYEGLNGQLPNLDVINTITTIARNENFKVSIQGTLEDELGTNSYYTRLRTLLKGVLSLAVAGLNSDGPGCESFSGWQIQAVTIRAVGTGGPDITQIGRVVDSTFRAVNNLLEKFHQSFFFYLMLTPLNFVSIGTYLPSAVLLAAAFAVSSVYCLAIGVSLKQYVEKLAVSLSIFTGVEFVCVVTAISLTQFVIYFPGHVSTLIALSFIASISLSFMPLCYSQSSGKLSQTVSYLLIALTLYFISMLIVSLLIVHFSLALCLGICALPLTFIPPLVKNGDQHSEPSCKSRLKISLCLAASSPLTAIMFLGYILLDGKFEGIVNLMFGLLSSWKDMQCWTWFVLSLGWLPAWLVIATTCAFGRFSAVPKPKSD